MDPISASTYSLSVQKDADEAKISTGSLGDLENKDFRNLVPQIVATMLCTANHVVVGIALAYSAVLIPQLEADTSDIQASKTETSWIASVFALVSPVGVLLSGYLMDKIGRINVLKWAVVPGVVGWVLIATARNVPMLILGRIISGLSSNLSTSPVVVYVTEIARKDMRGSLSVLGPSYVSLGLVIAYLKGWLISWRTIAWTCNIYVIVPLVFLYLIPESPIWLISKGRIDEAKKSLEWLHKHQPDHQDKSFAELQLQLLIKDDEKKKLEAKMTGGGAVREFLKPTGYKPMLILFGLFFFQQFSGIYIFLFYSVTFFGAVGSSVNPYLASVFIGIIRLVMALLNTWLLKNFNRRILLIISALGMAVCTTISGCFTHWIKNGTTQLTWVPAVFLLLYVVASMVGVLTIPWTMTAELFPLKIRSIAHSIATSVCNVLLFVAVQSYVNMEELFGGSAGVQWFFAGISLGTAVYVWVLLPETHKKKLSEIEEYFKHNTLYLGQKKKVVRVPRRREGGQDKRESNKLINHA